MDDCNECKKLRARVAELEGASREVLFDFAAALKQQPVDDTNSVFVDGESGHLLNELLNRTPTQSLAAIRAQTLREFANSGEVDGVVVSRLYTAADRIEQDGEVMKQMNQRSNNAKW